MWGTLELVSNCASQLELVRDWWSLTVVVGLYKRPMSCIVGNQAKCILSMQPFLFFFSVIFSLSLSLFWRPSWPWIQLHHKSTNPILTIGIKASFLPWLKHELLPWIQWIKLLLLSILLLITITGDIQEIQKIQGIHTRTLNEMNQNINVILQKLNSIDVNQNSPQRKVQSNSIPSSSTLSLAKSVKLDFPRFSGVDLANWVYKANQYFRYY